MSIQRNVARLRKVLRDRFNSRGQIYVQHRVAEYRAMWEAVADELGATFSPLQDDVWQLELGGRRMRIFKHILEMDDPVTLELAARKALVYRMLHEHGLRVPEHLVFSIDRLDDAETFLRKHQGGCVVKPASGTGAALGVTTHVRTPKELRRAAILASLYCPDILIEPLIAGECYRILVFRGKMIHAVKRRGLRLRSNGTASIRALIEMENAKRRSAGRDLVVVDRDCTFTLDAQGLSLDSIPSPGAGVLVRSTGESTGSLVEYRTVYTEAVTDEIADQLRLDAEKAAALLGSELVGVDFITPDGSIPLEASGGVVNELNTTPGLHHHYFGGGERYPAPALSIASVLLKP